MISQTAEYCLRAVVCLAATAGKPQTTQQIADATKIPVGYLSKVLQALGRAGMVSAQRGLNGGFLLGRDPATLSLLEVVRVADPSRRVSTCPLGIHGTDLCPLHRQLDEAAATAERILTSRTIADLMKDPGIAPTTPLCPVTSGVAPCLK
jgi:Rrf2 family protein